CRFYQREGCIVSRSYSLSRVLPRLSDFVTEFPPSHFFSRGVIFLRLNPPGLIGKAITISNFLSLSCSSGCPPRGFTALMRGSLVPANPIGACLFGQSFCSVPN